MACPHVSDSSLRPPRPSESVYREDCTQCFNSTDDPAGLDVCLKCFNGGCPRHAPLHHARTGHALALNIKRRRKLAPVERDEPPAKLTKLAVSAEKEEDRYDTTTDVKCYECSRDQLDSSQESLQSTVQGILKANTFAKQAEVQAWELELTPCEHTLCLEQEDTRAIPSGDLGHCAKCDLKENLWLCLTCGNLGCGRGQYGGVGGNSHGLAHYNESKHPVSVKLGSITAEGTADIYCYACDEERVDPELQKHLATWGIALADRIKTEKSLAELQIEHNLRWEFSMTDEDGREMKKLTGQGLTGLKNLGNSCYINGIVQSLMSLPAFQQRYFHPDQQPPESSAPAEDLETQLRKLADGLLSGKYSKPDPDVFTEPNSSEIPHQKGLVPAMFKHLVGRGHEEFSTMRQQDAFEFLLHLFKLITRSSHPSSLEDPVKSFRFMMEQRLQCKTCKKVKYRQDEQDNISIPVPARRLPKQADDEGKTEFEPVSLKECLDIFTAPENVELTCPACGSKDGFTKQTKFATFPQNLAINARRFELVNWVPTKLDIPVIVPEADFPLDQYKSNGIQSGEEPLPDDAEAPGSAPAFVANEVALQQLEAMGMPKNRAEKALHATGNSDAEVALNWLMEHMEDADIDAPLVFDTPSGAAGGADVSQESLDTLAAMGITIPVAREALKETGGDLNRALDWAFNHPDDPGDDGSGSDAIAVDPPTKTVPGDSSVPANFKLRSIVCHKGASVHAGHYVAFVKKTLPGVAQDQWVLFNDEKVVEAGDNVEEMKKFAYVYFFERVFSA